MLFYPPNKRFYGYSKGIAKPIIFCTTYQEALKLVDEKYLTYSSSMEIDLEYENADEKVTINRIHRRQYNKKENQKRRIIMEAMFKDMYNEIVIAGKLIVKLNQFFGRSYRNANRIKK